MSQIKLFLNGFPYNQGYPCPTNYNPADFYILNLAIMPGKEDDCTARVGQICDQFEDSREGLQLAESVSACRTTTNPTVADFQVKKHRSPYKASWAAQFSAVMWRSWISVVQNPKASYIKLIAAIVRWSFNFIYLKLLQKEFQ